MSESIYADDPLGSHRLTHRAATCDCGWAGTAAEHRAHIRWHCPNRTGRLL